ncbi:MAG: sulfotransferase [Gemmatimonadaceae bacterium]|nr:sulfotransferase [Gemmatimonadaceae bacterium]
MTSHHTQLPPAQSNAPVFVVGSPRSGTTLLYHMLLSAGRFVRYRTETHVFNTLAPRFGGMRTAADRRGALEMWLASDCHTLTGLSAAEVRDSIERECRGPGDFLRLVMEAMGRRQRLPRWAEATPAHVLHMREIRAQIPNALFVQVVRDGRDVAASLTRQGWIRPLARDSERPALAAAAYWQWIMRRGRDEARGFGSNVYLEVRYEDLVDAPVETLGRIGNFIGQSLDWETIQRVGIGSVGKPNTSFPDAKSGGFKGRWRTELTVDDARLVDTMLSATLRDAGYDSDSGRRTVAQSAHYAMYACRFAVRDALKRHTPLGRRLTDVSFFSHGSMRVTEEKLEQAAAADPP